MSQQLIEETKSPYITLDEFIPTWTQIVEDGKGGLVDVAMEELYGISITHSNMCVVGEAHGNNNDYCRGFPGTNDKYCKICDGISHNHRDSPLKISVFSAISDKEQFLQLKKYLYTHMIDYHPEKMLR